MLGKRVTGRYKETKFYWVGTEVGFAHSTGGILERAKPLEREGAILSSCFRRGEGGRLPLRLLTPEVLELQRKLYQKAKQGMRKPLEEDDRKAVYGETVRAV